MVALCVCSREAVKSMKKHEIEGQIVHVASMIGHDIQYTPFTNTVFNVYAPCKASVVALAETLRKELKREKVRIKVSVSPTSREGRYTTENAKSCQKSSQRASDLVTFTS